MDGVVVVFLFKAGVSLEMFRILFPLTVLVTAAYAQSADLASLLAMTANVTNKAATWNATVPACSWEGVICDEVATVSELHWRAFHLGGVIDLTSMPANIISVDVSYNQLMGSPNLSALPSSLRVLDVSGNGYAGVIDLTHVWGGMTSVRLDTNRFSGSGTFEFPAAWCRGNQKQMCFTNDGMFDCAAGTWTC